MPEAPIGTNVHEPLDVHGNLLAQISFHSAAGIDYFTDPAYLFLGEILDSNLGTDAHLIQNSLRPHPPDAIDVGEADLDTLIAW